MQFLIKIIGFSYFIRIEPEDKLKYSYDNLTNPRFSLLNINDSKCRNYSLKEIRKYLQLYGEL